MFFRSWSDIWHVVLASTITFAVIVVLLRIVGQQALAKMSGYDIVVTVVRKSDVPSDDSAFFGLPIPGREHRRDQGVTEKPTAASPYRIP